MIDPTRPTVEVPRPILQIRAGKEEIPRFRIDYLLTESRAPLTCTFFRALRYFVLEFGCHAFEGSVFA